ncbi:hypothetical protein ACHAW6_006488 [Cyclotella cf. meneghiniana]
MGVEPRTKLVELVRCSSSPCDGRGACAMAVELERWWQSSCDGGGAHAMVVELVNARAMRAACAMGVEPRTKLVELVRCSSRPCDGRGARAMAVELE